MEIYLKKLSKYFFVIRKQLVLTIKINSSFMLKTSSKQFSIKINLFQTKKKILKFIIH